jgi:uncharacterized protein
VCLMLKAPVPGSVKTRLAVDLGDGAACAAYRRLVEHQLDQIPSAWTVEVHGTPVRQLALIQNWLGVRRSMDFFGQVEGDLGARMEAATKGAFGRGADCVVLLGGDCAELDVARLTELEHALAKASVAIVPAHDGGYVALGMRQCFTWLFQDMPWSQETLMEHTRAALRQHQVSWVEQSACGDVDVLADWLIAEPLLAQ